ncbi:MAG: hypothetical protein K6G01_02990 [Eubacterium sp.]|nr:hypothetical protein [Eubacterium sp.]
MVFLEGMMIAIGVILMIGSFFVMEKLSPKELQKVAEISDEEIKKIVEKGMQSAQNQVDEKVDVLVEESVEHVEGKLDHLTNEKIMAVDEFSQTILEKIHTNHEEVMFLYSMLNDKHSELTDFANELQTSINDLRAEKKDLEVMKVTVDTTLQNTFQEMVNPEPEEESVKEEEEIEEEELPQEAEQVNHNGEIIRLYKEGLDVVEIAKQLGIGQGEVKFVLDLHQIDTMRQTEEA